MIIFFSGRGCGYAQPEILLQSPVVESSKLSNLMCTFYENQPKRKKVDGKIVKTESLDIRFRNIAKARKKSRKGKQ